MEKERGRLIEIQQQFDVKRHEMMDRENLLRVKQSELENSIMKVKQREVCGLMTFYRMNFYCSRALRIVDCIVMLKLF